MPNQEKRNGKATGFWYGEVDRRAKGGERFRRRFETKKQAEVYEHHVKTLGYEPDGSGARAAGITYADAIKAYCVRHPMARDRSGRARMNVLTELLGAEPVSTTTQETLDDLVDKLETRPGIARGKGLTDGSINRYLSGLSSVIKWTRKRTKAGDTPIPHIELPWRTEKGHRIHWFTEEQEAAVCAYLTSQGWKREALALRVLCATGLRWGEFAGLEPHQCQPEWIRLDETKTDTPRDVPIDPALSRELLVMVRSESVPNYETMRKHLGRAVVMCGYSSHLGIHNARHSTATRLIKAGEALPIVQKFLGHRNIKTTMKYIHVESADLAAASKKLYPQRGETPQNDPAGVVLPFMKSIG